MLLKFLPLMVNFGQTVRMYCGGYETEVVFSSRLLKTELERFSVSHGVMFQQSRILQTLRHEVQRHQ